MTLKRINDMVDYSIKTMARTQDKDLSKFLMDGINGWHKRDYDLKEHKSLQNIPSNRS